MLVTDTIKITVTTLVTPMVRTLVKEELPEVPEVPKVTNHLVFMDGDVIVFMNGDMYAIMDTQF